MDVMLALGMSMILFQGRTEERTCFQVAHPYDARIDIRSDVAIVYGINPSLPERLKGWKEHGYITHLMTGVAWGGYQDYLYGRFDGEEHLDDAQMDREGNRISHGGDVYYMVPTKPFTEYLKTLLKVPLDLDVEAIHLEEPEFWVRGGYSEGFKREWREFYGTEWVDPESSEEAFYKASKLKQFLYYRSAEPLILSGFPSRDGVLLRWETESEISNVGFVVYRRDEGGGYKRIKFISSVGNTAFPTSYTFIDRDVSPGGTYYYYVESVDISGMRRESRVIRVRVPVEESNRFALLQSYPNPFNSEVWIPYELGGEVPVVIEIYDGVGHLVRKLDLGLQPGGRYVSKLRSGYWDGRDMDGNRVASGVYYYVLRAGSFMAIGKMTIIK